MQSFNELVDIISKGRPDIDLETIEKWAKYLGQLKGCHLYSVAAPEKDMKEWLMERKAGIGGSEIACILGASNWNSARHVWLSKMGMFDDKPQKQSEQARWGNILETTVATEWALRENRKWIHIPVILQDDERSYLLANIDGFTLSDDEEQVVGILEIKTTSAYNNDIWEFGPLPDNYLHQTNWYCGITRLPCFDIVCLVGGQKLYSYHMLADAERHRKQVEAADAFWNQNMLKGIEPEATAVDKQEVLDNAEADGEPVIFEGDEVENLTEAYCQLRDKMSTLKELKDEISAKILVALGSAPEGVTKTHSVKIIHTNRRSVNYEKLENMYPDAFADCVSHTASKQLRID